MAVSYTHLDVYKRQVPVCLYRVYFCLFLVLGLFLFCFVYLLYILVLFIEQ